AYTALSSNMQKDFEAVSVASPMSADIKYGTTRIDWDNDIVPRIATAGGSLPWMTLNNVRRVNWESNNVFGTGKPASNYTVASNIGKIYTNGGYNYLAEEAGIDIPSKVHAFTFYMGQPLGIDDGAAIRDPFTNAILVETTAKAKIMQAISTKLEILGECKCSDANNIINPENGIIEIALSWTDSNIRMSLSSAIGTKDIVASECSTFEHYYVKTEDDVSPGRYAVNVSNAGDVDESSLPQNVSLSIATPGEAMVFNFNITAADMLNIGHVADIIISEDKRIKLTYSGTTDSQPNIVIYSDSSGGNGDDAYVPYSHYIYDIQSKLKQALLGPLSNAIIELSDARDEIPFYQSSTSGDNSILTSGVFYFPLAILNTLEDEKYYILSASGGDDIDSNDDGVLDTTATQNNGTIHVIVTGKQLKTENFKINVLTEIVYQLSKDSIVNADINATAVNKYLSDISKRLLSKDVNNDNIIDYEDILNWLPMFDKDKLLKPYIAYYQPIVWKIYNNKEIYDESYSLAYDSEILHITENSPAGSVVGKPIDLYDAETGYYTLSGEGSDLFNITQDSTIILNSAVKIDYELRKSYDLNLSSDTGSRILTTKFTILVDDINDAPTVVGFQKAINEDSPSGTIVDKLFIGSTPSISEVVLEGEGSEKFNVDLEGTITVAPNALFEYNTKSLYMLDTYAINEFGNSLVAKVEIRILCPYCN
ncbi:hypothetical protein KJ870_10405, partial [bacterium]|nr:hypothetical protein [bacterium]MBU1435338.1 hypothetical protein [bacterium]MBU1503536.1 hypothetical protein [bacterium]